VVISFRGLRTHCAPHDQAARDRTPAKLRWMAAKLLVFFMRRPLSEAALVHNRPLLSLRLISILDFVARSERVHRTHQKERFD
jgi:hypothetical protein